MELALFERSIVDTSNGNIIDATIPIRSIERVIMDTLSNLRLELARGISSIDNFSLQRTERAFVQFLTISKRWPNLIRSGRMVGHSDRTALSELLPHCR
jgi:hypothetical protein